MKRMRSSCLDIAVVIGLGALMAALGSDAAAHPNGSEGSTVDAVASSGLSDGAGSSASLPGPGEMNSTYQDTGYNPDPGASQKPVPAPFYQPPPGTPPDYQSVRDPLTDLPHAPLLDIHTIPHTWQNRSYVETELPPGTQGVPDRWDLAIPIWMRYNNPEPETPYENTAQLWDPFKQSVLKGDLPVLGQDIFIDLTASSFTSYEARDIPTPSGVSAASSNSSEFFGEGNQQEVDQFFDFKIDLFKGETVFQPVTWLLHLEPVYNINYTSVKENGVLSADPRGSSSQSDNNGVLTNNSGNTGSSGPGFTNPGGLTPGNPSGIAGGGFTDVGAQSFGSQYLTRTKDFLSLQQAFLELHLADFDDSYDFISMRVGNQPFNSDFRGFVFNDTNLGIRFFGNADSNRWQYNLAAFAMREKDTYSELNTFDSRHQYVIIANAYRQDFLVKGYTGQLSFLADFDDADEHYDRTGDLVDPEPLGGPIQPHNIRSYYFGWNGDGHIGRFNFTHSFYEVVGQDEMNGLAGQSVSINAQMAAMEVSYDQDWIRFKASFFYGSGDSKPTNGQATGFDSIIDNPDFIGGPFSYYARQGFIFGDTAVDFKQRDSLLLDLRSSKDEGQPNYVNPGVFIYGVGTDMDVLPTMKLFFNANYIRMADTEPVNFALHTDNISSVVGWDLSMGVKYRPLLNNNVIVSAGLGALLPGDGYRAIYQSNTIPVPGYDDNTPPGHVDSFLYSGFVSVTFTY
jgi:hypothetical protein